MIVWYDWLYLRNTSSPSPWSSDPLPGPGVEPLEEESGYLLMCRGGRETLPSLLLPPSLCPGLGGRREGGEGEGFQAMGGALVLHPLELVLPPARGGVGGAGFPVLGEEGVGLGGLGGGLSSSPLAPVFWLSESSRNEGESPV